MTARLTLEDVRRAAAAIAPHLPPTPLRRSFALHPRNAWLKLECWQPTGAFKVRGALAHLSSLTAAEKRAGIVAASAGNHALGVAWAAAALGGIEVTLFVPESAPRAKVDKLRSFPVRTIVSGATYDDAHHAAMEHVAKTGAHYVHAFDDPRTAAGQGTVALEIAAQLPDLATVVVPVGGGGLICGMAAALHEVLPRARVVAVQPDASPALRDSIAAGRPLYEYDAAPTLADGLSGGIGDIVFAHRDLIDEVVTVSESEIGEAMRALLARDQVLAEASGAVGVAAIMAGRVTDASGPVAVVITGANVDTAVLARLLGAAPAG